ncbi:DNA-methyltransferase [Brucella intermedia]|uniref:DNA-methyltransferase n=1 Tax=Brucella intermedia TaxID=94625 RepID=UPI00124DB883|nr:site-specific DNA-methyltransferase [Brucella intermedia]KAB2716625.1 site-specific DNA-methyltransferase [Brucella intermedia]
MGTEIMIGDCREILATLPSGSVDSCVTSPPYYGLRDYGVETQIGLEQSPEEYVAEIVGVFREVKRILKDDGTLWLNLGDSTYSGNGRPTQPDTRSPNRNFRRSMYHWLDRPGAGLPKKSLLGIPWRVAHALQQDGWTIRQEIIWHRTSAFVEPSVKDRPYRQHETVFLMSKSRWYWFDRSELSEESVWQIEPERAVRKHIAPFPQELVRRCIQSGCKPGGTVIDPFAGSGTTGLVAEQLGRKAICIELNPEYAHLAQSRTMALFSATHPSGGDRHGE